MATPDREKVGAALVLPYIHKTPASKGFVKDPSKNNHHEGDVHGVPEDDEEMPLLLTESLPEVPKDLASLKETELASAGSFFIGVNGGLPESECGVDDDNGCAISSSSPEEEPIVSNRDGDESGVSNGVSTLPSLS